MLNVNSSGPPPSPAPPPGNRLQPDVGDVETIRSPQPSRGDGDRCDARPLSLIQGQQGAVRVRRDEEIGDRRRRCNACERRPADCRSAVR